MKIKSVLLFIVASFIFFNCSDKKSASELYNDGEKFSGEQNYSEAAKSFEELLTEFPDDTLAPITTAKIASMYQNKLVPNIAEIESFRKAAELFKSIYQKFPDSEQSPTGLFMAGFVEANELNDFDSATKTYNLFIEIYPDHELVVSAKEELENMGLTPEEILQKNLSRQ